MNESGYSERTFLAANGRNIEVLGVLVTLVFLGWQTLQMNRNIDEIKKSVVLDSHEAVHEHRQRINQILLSNDKELAMTVFGLEKETLVGFTLVSDYESLFRMRCSGVLPDPMWYDIETMIYNTLTKNTFLSKFWETYRPAISARFASYVAELTNAAAINRGVDRRYCD